MTDKSKKNAPAKAKASNKPLLRHHPFVVPVITFLGLFFITLSLLVSVGGQTLEASDTRVVSLYIDGKEQTVPTRAQTVRDLLQRLDIHLVEKDIVEPALDTAIDADDFSVNIYKARPVLVIDEGKKVVTVTAAPTPQAVAESAGVTIYAEDKIETVSSDVVSAQDVLREGIVAETIVIDRATPTHLNLYGTQVELRTHAKTVEQLLAEKNIVLNEGDTLRPAADTVLKPDTQIFVLRLGKEIAQVEETIPQPVETIEDFSLTLGSSQVKEAGKLGRKLVTYELELENGKEVARKIIQEVIIEQPTKKVIAKGKKAPVVAGNRVEIMLAAGIPADQHYAADFIIAHESGWRVNARNASGCAGLGQACPGSKLANVCPNWESDPVCQMGFFNGYAVGRYGSWSRAYEIWQLQRWW